MGVPAVSTPALSGIRVLEVAGGVALAYAAKLFADLGADVVRAETPDGDVVRSRPHEVHRWLNTNKRSSFDPVSSLVAGADVVLHDRGPARATAEGLTDGALRAVGGPGLVVCSMTPFGMTGPYADFTAEEIGIIHGSSWGNVSPSSSQWPDRPPLKAPGHHASLNVATIAATAALAAVLHARTSGTGSHVDFSMFAAAAKMTEAAPAQASFQDLEPTRMGAKVLAPWSMYRCADGFVQFICPEEQQWVSFVAMIGSPEWSQLEVFATASSRRENVDVLNLYLSEWMAERRVADVVRAAQAARVCISPVNSMDQLAADPQLRSRGFVVATPDGLDLPGPGFVSPDLGWSIRSAAPAPGADTGAGWQERPAVAGSVPVASGPAPGRPLDGVRICDFTWIWAGPFCTQLLAHLGADVIRLESPTRTCLFRRLPYPPWDMEMGLETAGLFHLYNTDKRSVGIDLQHPSARAVVEELVRRSDIVIDNFGVGTMARLGFSPEELRRINPDVIVASLTGFGQTGEAAGYMAYGPVGGAVAGLYSAFGYEGGDPMETGIAVGDPATGLTAAWAVMAALWARRAQGTVATIDVAMVEAIAATVGELWMQHRATGVSPRPHGNRDPQWVPHGCYRSAGDDKWVTIACTTTRQWEALCSVVDPALADDPRFATAAARAGNEDVLDACITEWTRVRDRWDATHELQAVGVAAFPSLSPMDLWGRGDAQLDALGMREMPEHPVVGRRVIPGVPWLLTPGANGLRWAAPVIGQHTVEVLTDVLGITHEQVADLLQVGAVTQSTLIGPSAD